MISHSDCLLLFCLSLACITSSLNIWSLYQWLTETSTVPLIASPGCCHSAHAYPCPVAEYHCLLYCQKNVLSFSVREFPQGLHTLTNMCKASNCLVTEFKGDPPLPQEQRITFVHSNGNLVRTPLNSLISYLPTAKTLLMATPKQGPLYIVGSHSSLLPGAPWNAIDWKQGPF